MATFMDSVQKAMPYLKRQWSTDVTPPVVPSDPPVIHYSEKASTKKERGFSDLALIVKAQQMAVPAGPPGAGGDVAAASQSLAAPTAWPAGR